MMTFQVPRELPPSQQPIKEATLNHLTHCAPVQHRPSDRSAPLHHQSPSSISYPPTCGDRASSIIIVGFTVCEYMGQYDQQSFQHPSQRILSSSSTTSAAAATAHHNNQPSVYCLGLCCPGTEGPAQLNPSQ